MLKNNLREEILNYDIKPKKSLGQNFLNDDNTLTKIAELCGERDLTILEIGAGTGVLTDKLSQRYKRVVAFEIDDDLIPLLKEKFKEFNPRVSKLRI